MVSIEYDPNRTCYIMLINYKDGDKRYQIEIENFQTRYWLLKSQLKKVEEL